MMFNLSFICLRSAFFSSLTLLDAILNVVAEILRICNIQYIVKRKERVKMFIDDV